ncbi:MAG: putative glycoside hydrolase [Aerococcus sp.]|nr:putative glycoside hydrolase [Aerococcus sp.]
MPKFEQRQKRQYRHHKAPHSRWQWIVSGILILGALVLLLAWRMPSLFGSLGIGGPTANQQALREMPKDSIKMNNQGFLSVPKNKPSKFYRQSDVNISYPNDGVKGIYLSAYGMGQPQLLEKNLKLVEDTGLNSVVIDVKSDWGSIATPLTTDNELINKNVDQTFDGKTLMKRLEKSQIYPIARITTFKDNTVTSEHPEWSFREASGEVWTDAGGQSFLNPFNKDAWKYIVDIAKGAAQLGFKDIQFDYVRFPEGFETFAESLNYDMGDYAEYGKGSVEARQHAIADFLSYANKELREYGVDVSADLFGYVATTKSAPGIGQNYQMMAEQVDHISGMIYPSHWQAGDFGYPAPDKEPYGVVNQYIQVEKANLEELGKNATKKPRPWLQAFTADYLGSGMYMEYDTQAVQDQINALADNDIHEYLLWNAANDYDPNVDYK